MDFRELIKKAQEAGHDAFGFATDPDLNIVSMKVARDEFFEKFNLTSFQNWTQIVSEISNNEIMRNAINRNLIVEILRILIVHQLMRKLPPIASFFDKTHSDLLNKAFILKTAFEDDLKNPDCQCAAYFLQITVFDALRLFGPNPQPFSLE